MLIKRYLSKTKFLDLIESKTLYYASLYSMYDDWEHKFMHIKSPDCIKYPNLKYNCFISCWTKDEDKINTKLKNDYIGENNSGVIVEIEKNLIENLLNKDLKELKEYTFECKDIEYFNKQDKTNIIDKYATKEDLLDSIFRKRKEDFEYEQEYRFAIYPTKGEGKYTQTDIHAVSGIRIPFKDNKLPTFNKITVLAKNDEDKKEIFEKIEKNNTYADEIE